MRLNARLHLADLLLIRVGGLITIKLPDLFRIVCRHDQNKQKSTGLSVPLNLRFCLDRVPYLTQHFP